MHHGNLINPSGRYANQSDTEPHPQVSGHNLITLIRHLLMKTLQYLYFFFLKKIDSPKDSRYVTESSPFYLKWCMKAAKADVFI